MQHKESSTLEEQEEKFVDFFRIVKSYEEKYRVVFLSKRFFLLYSILLKKYPEIELADYKLQEEILDSKLSKKVLYINDINYELPKRIRFNDIIATYIRVTNFSCCNIANSPYGNIEDLKKAEDESLFLPKKLEKKMRHFVYDGVTRVSIDILAKETEILGKNGIVDALDFVPDFLKNYFNFYADNSEELNYFLRKLYTGIMISDIETDEERIKIKVDVILDMCDKFGVENLSSDLILWLLENNTANYDYLHTPIKRYSNSKLEDVGKVKKIGAIPIQE